MKKSYYNIIETLAFICSINKGELQVLLKKKQTEPYRGSWILPNNILSTDETLETSIKNIVYETTGTIVKKMMQAHVFSELNRDEDSRILASSYIVVLSKHNIKSSEQLGWFSVDKLPNMGYDHEKIINCVFKILSKKIIYNENDIVRDLFPTAFTLVDLQKFWESISDKKYDRRNFRKKLITDGLIVETGCYDRCKTGRPSKFYVFTDKLYEGKIL